MSWRGNGEDHHGPRNHHAAGWLPARLLDRKRHHRLLFVSSAQLVDSHLPQLRESIFKQALRAYEQPC